MVRSKLGDAVAVLALCGLLPKAVYSQRSDLCGLIVFFALFAHFLRVFAVKMITADKLAKLQSFIDDVKAGKIKPFFVWLRLPLTTHLLPS